MFLLLLYIDPGTGSMLFSLAVGVLSAAWFGVRALLMKAKYRTGGKADTNKKDIVIYGEDKRYWTTFKGILDEFERRQVKVTYLAGSADDPLLSQGYRYVETEVIGLGNKAYARLNFLNARIVLATTPGLDVYQWKRSKDVDWYVHLTHYIGSGIDYRMFGTAFFDALLLSSNIFIPQCRKLESALELGPKDIVPVGCTYMDYLLERRLSDDVVTESDSVRVLVAPTWGTESLFHQFGTELLDQLAAGGYDITLRPHPQSYISNVELIKELQERYPESALFHWNNDADNYEALKNADILISDYSGIIYDFAFIFERPVIFARPQSLEFPKTDQFWTREPVWNLAVLPQLGQELSKDNMGEIVGMINHLVHSDQSKESIRRLKEESWLHQGHAAEVVTDYLLDKCEELKSHAAS